VHKSPRLCFPRRVLGAALLATFALVATACGSSSAVGGRHAPAAAAVNGHQLSQAGLNDELTAIAANVPYATAISQSQSGVPVVGQGGKGTFSLAFADKVLQRQILLEVIHQEVVRRKIVLTPADIQASLASQQAQMGNDAQGNPLWPGFSPTYQKLLATRAAEVTALQNALSPSDDAAVQKYYDANKAKLSTNCVSHILVKTQAQAQSLHDQLVAGADFATLARTFSTDTASAAKGGDLGCAPAGTYVPEFEAAVAGLAVGQMSGVVHSQFGYHIIKVTGRKTQLADVRSQVLSALQTQAQQQLSNFVQAEVGKANIAVNPSYGTFDKASGQINPPAPPPASAGGTGTTTTSSLPPGLGQPPSSTP
jgi:parvulin-like peptidyl-prolyl isomerase